MGGAAQRKEVEELNALFESDPLLRNSHKWFDMTREEQMAFMYKRCERLHQIDHKRFYTDFKPTTHSSYLWLLQGEVSTVTCELLVS